MKFPIGKAKQNAIVESDLAEDQSVTPILPHNPFFSFSYSRQEMHFADGVTRVKSTSFKYEDGKMVSERFEGNLPAPAFEQAAQDMQRQFVEQANQMLKQWTPWFLLLGRQEKAEEK